MSQWIKIKLVWASLATTVRKKLVHKQDTIAVRHFPFRAFKEPSNHDASDKFPDSYAKIPSFEMQLKIGIHGIKNRNSYSL